LGWTPIDETNPTVNSYAAFTYHISGDHRLTRKHAERAVSLNPNDPFAIYVLACALSYTGEPEQALEWFARSERLEPYAPDDQRLDTLCDCYYMIRNYAKVIEIHEVYQNVPAFLYLVLAAAYAQAGQSEKAAAAVKIIRTTPSSRSRLEDAHHILDENVLSAVGSRSLDGRFPQGWHGRLTLVRCAKDSAESAIGTSRK
jgi:adenylate cyclase